MYKSSCNYATHRVFLSIQTQNPVCGLRNYVEHYTVIKGKKVSFI